MQRESLYFLISYNNVMALDVIVEQQYKPEGKILWDPWFIHADGILHMFHLQAPESAKSGAESRGDNADIGHSVSDASGKLSYNGTALSPGIEGVDDLSLWTGSIILHNGLYRMLYTQRTRQKPLEQTLGLATSTDIFTWNKHASNPVLQADNKLYVIGSAPDTLGFISAFRDPYLFAHPENGDVYMTFSARTGSGRPYDAAIGLAKALDSELSEWELLPPLIAPQLHAEIEVSQTIFHEGKWYVFYASRKHASRVPGHNNGLYGFVSENGLQGNYEPANGNGVVIDNNDLLRMFGYDIFNVRLLDFERNGNRYPAIGAIESDASGMYIGRISPRFAIEVKGTAVRMLDDITAS
jgi:beta-fructofuranosidase